MNHPKHRPLWRRRRFGHSCRPWDGIHVTRRQTETLRYLLRAIARDARAVLTIELAQRLGVPTAHVRALTFHDLIDLDHVKGGGQGCSLAVTAIRHPRNGEWLRALIMPYTFAHDLLLDLDEMGEGIVPDHRWFAAQQGRLERDLQRLEAWIEKMLCESG